MARGQTHNDPRYQFNLLDSTSFVVDHSASSERGDSAKLDGLKRVVRRNQLFEIERMKDFTLAIDSSTHQMSSMTRIDALYGSSQVAISEN